jgi:hypothetical protein
MSEPQADTNLGGLDDEMERRRTDYMEMEQAQYVLGRDVTAAAKAVEAVGSGGERDLWDFHSECPPKTHDLHPDPQDAIPFLEEQLEAIAFDAAVQNALEKEKPDPMAGNVPEFHGDEVGDSFGDTAGFKFDAGKLRYDLIPMEAMKALATILTMGAKKYADRNWEGGMSWQRVYASLMRHLVAYESGEDTDPESGELHMAHALCNVVFLVTYQMRPSLADFDDRPKPELLTESTVGSIARRDIGYAAGSLRLATDPPLTMEEYRNGGVPMYAADYGYVPGGRNGG